MATSSVIVTGGSGLIGSHLTPALRALGHDVVALAGRVDRDLTVPEVLVSAPVADVVVHLAAVTGVDQAWADPEPFVQANLAMTLQVLRYVRRNRPRRLIYVSSYVYGQPDQLPVDESHPVRPANPYAMSKHLGEQLCQGLASRDLDVVVVRPFNVYGPGQDRRFLIPTIIDQLLAGPTVRLMTGSPRRDYLHAADAADALCRIVARSEPMAGIYNLGSAKAHSVADVVDLLRAASGKQGETLYSGQERPYEVNEVLADCSRIQAAVGWKPRLSLQDGLRQVWEAEHGGAQGAS